MTHDFHAWSEALLGFFEAYHNLIIMLMLTGIRIMVTFILLPATSDTALPGTARNGVVYVLTMFVAAGQVPQAFDSLNSAALLVLACKEAFLGFAFGYCAAPVFWIAQSLGTLIDDLAGFNNVQMTNPLRGDQSTPVSTLLLQLVVTLFYVGGGMLFVLGALFQSFKWWPPYVLYPSLSNSAETFLIQRTDTIWTALAKLGTPVMLVLVLVDLGLGIVARAADKLEPSSLSQPLRGVIGVLMLIALVAVFASQVVGDVQLGGLSAALAKGMLPEPAH
ncbi:type III secretion system export apparatus subunit SctT [Paraburkholderia sp. 22099]|jgi:type III secretion protein T|uniref:Type III secretion protein T n=1 Tax=Paraburkholderia terricola TaxID=169427 RepID=A0A1M6VI07_9BURK|nr:MULTISPECIES: type III secretion system export apparatus subunit SctT [Paraburkholderia]ORC52871.1 EscT/YscT/HrcT family type III secretion system export apparatus protein [Burkholderia sp. A27]AXE95061.1 EscT/YscT/HrcT family type III secretion system export apparatus protein [Paraburkholderia terricola]MDR6410312.1 type III secretion protein T [Paraburkholderia terricola]MDR6444186.1 type III secretion protein T [Paraburkholderia terricola]MDR6481472.1 type III secretion protein T [Parabu